MRTFLFQVMAMSILLCTGLSRAHADLSGSATHENVLIGMHFLDGSSDDAARALNGGDPVNIAPAFYDYLKYMPEDLKHMSYADFWRWWWDLERYKGDEHGLKQLDAVVQECLSRGMKVKIDLAHSTWWTLDKDWETDQNMVTGPADLDDWAHICYLLGSRYRGKIALWLLLGEANTQDYWMGMTVRHAQEAYKIGSKAFKKGDPDTLISISGATPGEGGMTVFGTLNNRKEMDRWVQENLPACKGLYDDVPMNYFADVQGADPYGSLLEYYGSIRKILDSIGEKDVEVGSGESSVQWALSSYEIKGDVPWSTHAPDSRQPQLSEARQAWRLNETLGTFYDVGGNKWMMWGTEFAPGGGWVWRWGFRKYEDWWGVWPETHKIPGTKIVYGYDNPDGRKVDLSPGWSSSHTDPYHPDWQVFKFWSQAAPPFAESVRLPLNAKSNGPRVLRLGTYLQTEDRCVALFQNDDAAAIDAALDVTRAGWPDGTPVTIALSNEAIDYVTGKRTTGLSRTIEAKVEQGKIALAIPSVSGFTTVTIERTRREFAAQCVTAIASGSMEAGTQPSATVVVRNTGESAWEKGRVSISLYTPRIASKAAGREWKLDHSVAPGESASFDVGLPVAEATGRVTSFFRMRDNHGNWFGPALPVSTHFVGSDVPRKLIAHREVGHIRVQWFAPEHADGVKTYDLFRADGFGKQFEFLKRVEGTEYVDSPLEKDRAYYYHVVTVQKDGRHSRPSNEDNAKAISKPRFWDAEIVEKSIPATMRLGESAQATITLRNTGSKPWDLGRPEKESRLRLHPTQQWGSGEEGGPPDISLGDKGVIQPGQSVTVTFPYAPNRTGRFENHWILTLDITGKPRAYFGTPVIVETVVAGM